MIARGWGRWEQNVRLRKTSQFAGSVPPEGLT
jgi:hypothetical protein